MIPLSDYEYEYPPDLVAQRPLEERDASRMMVLDRKTNQITHKVFKDFLGYLNAGDVLVLNDTKVFPCRLLGKRSTGGRVECFLLREVEKNLWECLFQANKKVTSGTELFFEGIEALQGVVKNADGEIGRIKFKGDKNIFDLLPSIGHIPLPPYIKRPDQKDFDTNRYQTLFAEKTGSVAAPTAGFHFTGEILEALKKKGIIMATVTLHVGLGTFFPIRADDITKHKMHGEYYVIPNDSALLINRAKKEKRSVFVVGTTATRALESSVDAEGFLKAGAGYTEKFIYPPYSFKIVDHLLTNFHQPCSTLLVLVSALAGRNHILQAYKQAIDEKYRLFSYGDCMLIL